MGVGNIYGLLLLAVPSGEIMDKAISVASGAVEVLYICALEMLIESKFTPSKSRSESEIFS